MSRIIDLTLSLKPEMYGVEFEDTKILEKNGWNAKTLHLYSHSGTHLDAPIHFGVSNTTIEDISLERCTCSAWIVDLFGIASRTLIKIGHLGKVQNEVQPGEGILIKTGWSAYASLPKYRDELPRISLELAEWLANKKISILGVEPPSVADVNNKEELTAVHKALLKAEIIIVEGLTNLEAISKEKVIFTACPLKIAGGDGSPVRAFANEE